jgi:hypothetical protein
MTPQPWLKPEPIECRDPSELLSRLDPSSSLWAPFEYGQWAFRGQADASWDLIPRSMRLGQKLSFKDPSLRALLDGDSQIQAEGNLLLEFIELADEIGFQLPGDLTEVRFPWRRHETPLYGDQSWPPTNLLELAAIAQHHGIPTRLLDFTFNPLVAAYFAAAKPVQSACLAVWAVDVGFIQKAWASFERGIRVVQVSRGSNPFLHAQSGLFIYDAEGNSSSLRERILGHEIDSLTHINDGLKASLVQSPRVRCITVPTRHRLLLLEHLASRRVTRAHLQPTLDNVVGQLWAGLSGQAEDNQEGA